MHFYTHGPALTAACVVSEHKRTQTSATNDQSHRDKFVVVVFDPKVDTKEEF